MSCICLTITTLFTLPVFQVQEFVLLLSPVFQKALGVPHQTLVHSVEIDKQVLEVRFRAKIGDLQYTTQLQSKVYFNR